MPLDNLKITSRSQQESGSSRRRAGNACKAYRLAYNTKNMKPATVRKRAIELLRNGVVAGFIRELQKAHRQRHEMWRSALGTVKGVLAFVALS